MYAIPAACTLLGMIFYHIAAFGCTTFKYEFSSPSDRDLKRTSSGNSGSTDDFIDWDSINDNNDGFGFSYKTGYWSAEAGSGCSAYSSSSVSGVFKFGRFIGVVGALMIWAIFFAMVVASFFKYPKPKLVFKVIGICMGVLSFFSFLLLVGLSEDSLKLAGGGAVAILSAFIWAGGAASMFLCMTERERVVAAVTLTPAKTPQEAPETTVETADNKTVTADPDTTTNDAADDEV